MGSSPSSSCSSLSSVCPSWITPKLEVFEPTLPLLPPTDFANDFTSSVCTKREYDDDLMDLDDDEDVRDAVETRQSGRKAKHFHLASDEEDDDNDDTFIPDDAPPAKRQRHSSSPHPRNSHTSKLRSLRTKSTSGCSAMHHCPIPKCSFHSERYSDVDRHYKSVHEKLRFACPICDKKLTRRDAVKRHQEAGDACKKALKKKAKLLERQ